METLLDHHLAIFDRWLHAHLSLMSVHASTGCWRNYLTVITLLDQLDPKEYNWEQISELLEDPFIFIRLRDLFGERKVTIEFSRIVCKFLMDQKRAQSFWVNSQRYAALARCILEFMDDK